MAPREPVRLGVIGLGLVAQVVHLPNLRRYPDRFRVTHVCDLSASLATHVASTLPGDPRTSIDWRAVCDDREVDAVLVLTGGAHGRQVMGALQAGKHVLSEKPLCISRREARDLAAEAAARHLVLQVGYMKLHDPAMAPAREALATIGERRLVQVTVRHPTAERQSSHLGVRRSHDVDGAAVAEAQAYGQERTREAIGDVPDGLGRLYRDILLGSIVHELSVMRALGLPLPVRYLTARAWPLDPATDWTEPPSISALADLGDGSALQLAWIWAPDYPIYDERITVVGTAGAIRLDMPQPYGPNVEARLHVHAGDGLDARDTVRRAERDSGFLAELRAFHASVTDGAPVVSDAEGAAGDAASLQALAAAIASDLGLAIGGEAAGAALR